MKYSKEFKKITSLNLNDFIFKSTKKFNIKKWTLFIETVIIKKEDYNLSLFLFTNNLSDFNTLMQANLLVFNSNKLNEIIKFYSFNSVDRRKTVKKAII